MTTVSVFTGASFAPPSGSWLYDGHGGQEIGARLGDIYIYIYMVPPPLPMDPGFTYIYI